jgi:hypothetical protein
VTGVRNGNHDNRVIENLEHHRISKRGEQGTATGLIAWQCFELGKPKRILLDRRKSFGEIICSGQHSTYQSSSDGDGKYGFLFSDPRLAPTASTEKRNPYPITVVQDLQRQR